MVNRSYADHFWALLDYDLFLLALFNRYYRTSDLVSTALSSIEDSQIPARCDFSRTLPEKCEQ